MTRALALALLLPLAACGADTATPNAETPAAQPAEASGEAGEASGEAATSAAADTPLAPEATEETGTDLPATREIATTTEGEPVTITGVLVRETEFPLPFATYRPEEMEYEWGASGEGAGAHFTSGSGIGEARLTVFVPASDPGDLNAWIRSTAEAMGEPFDMEASAPWVKAAVAFSGIDIAGSIRAGRHAGRAFYVMETLPPEMGDGFATLAGVVTDQWQWLDDGSGL